VLTALLIIAGLNLTIQLFFLGRAVLPEEDEEHEISAIGFKRIELEKEDEDGC